MLLCTYFIHDNFHYNILSILVDWNLNRKIEMSMKFLLNYQFSFFKYTQNIIKKTYFSLYFFIQRCVGN